MRKRTTKGERIAKRMAYSSENRRIESITAKTLLPRAIDSALKKAVKKAHQNGKDLANPSCSLKLALERKKKLEAEFGVKL